MTKRDDENLRPSEVLKTDTQENQELINISSDGRRFEAAVTIGRVQAHNCVAAFGKALSTAHLKQIHDTKAYRELKGQQGTDLKGNLIPDLGTWDGFCKALGYSPSKAHEDIQNLEHFGQEFMEKMQLAGIGYQGFRRLRKLPEQDLVELEGRLVDTSDKGEVRELIEDIIEDKQEIVRQRDALQCEVRRETILRETAQYRLDDVLDQMQQQDATQSDWPPTAREVREESTALSALALDALDRMEKLLDRLIDPKMVDTKRDSLEYEAAARTLWINLQAVQAAASHHIAQFEKRLGENYMVLNQTRVPTLNSKDAASALSRIDMLLVNAENKAQARKSLRESTQKRGRGRPAGSKNKTARKG